MNGELSLRGSIVLAVVIIAVFSLFFLPEKSNAEDYVSIWDETYDESKDGMPCNQYDEKLTTKLATSCNRLATLPNAKETLQHIERIERSVDESQAVEETQLCNEANLSESMGTVLSGGTQVHAETMAEDSTDCFAEEVLAYVPSELVYVPSETEPIREVTDPAELLRQALINADIEWWFPYGLAQMTQESHGNQWAISADGLDYGIFQYRKTSPDGTIPYWEIVSAQYGVYADIFDPEAQIIVYVGQVKARISAGLSIEEIISRHYTSDYVTEINWQYVNDVLSHLN